MTGFWADRPGRGRVALLARYGISGIVSAVVHLGVLSIFVSHFGYAPAVATNLGFAASIVASYSLQRWWVFKSNRLHREAVPRFLLVTMVAAGLNASIVYVGTETLGYSALGPQLLALVVIPVSNFVLNGAFTFHAGAQGESEGLLNH